jgi:hypothetical protein
MMHSYNYHDGIEISSTGQPLQSMIMQNGSIITTPARTSEYLHEYAKVG